MTDVSLGAGKTDQKSVAERAASEKPRAQQPIVVAPPGDVTPDHKTERAATAAPDEKRQSHATDRSTSLSFRETDTARARTVSPAQSRQGSRPPDVGHSANIPKRPDLDRVASQPPRLPLPPNLPNKPEPPRGYNRSGRQSDIKDDRRDLRDARHSDSSRSSRYPDSDRDRLYDHEPRGPGRLDRDREPQRPGPPDDEQFHSSREARQRRESETDRAGPSRLATQPHPERANVIQGHPDRLALIEGDNQRRDGPRLDRDDRRHRLSSPTRSDERRGTRHDEFPAGPRSDRAARSDMPEGRESRPGGDIPHGRGPQDSRAARQPESANEIPLGPRGGSRAGQSRGRNVSMPQPPPSATPGRPAERLPPTGPSGRSSGRAPDSSTAPSPAPSGEKTETGGVHPDRLKNLQVSTESSPGNNRSQPSLPPSGPRNSLGGHLSGSPVTRTPPSGPGNDRSRSDKRFSGINNMLQQSGGGQERSGQGTAIRGRGRQAQDSGPPSPKFGGPDVAAEQERTELFPAAQEGENRPPGRGRRGEASHEANRELKRNEKHDNDRGRRDEDEVGKSGRRDERRDRGRDRDRERNRRNDNAEDDSHQGGKDSTNRRATGGRDDHRRRDRRDRDDGPVDLPGPSGSDHHGRNRPLSSHSGNNNTLANPPPAPAGPPNDDRRWGGGSGRGENRDRDRNRDRGGSGRERERDLNRDNAPGGNQSLPRKRGRPGDDNHGHGDGGPRGMRVGSESKRPRRGA